MHGPSFDQGLWNCKVSKAVHSTHAPAIDRTLATETVCELQDAPILDWCSWSVMQATDAPLGSTPQPVNSLLMMTTSRRIFHQSQVECVAYLRIVQGGQAGNTNARTEAFS